MSLRIAGKHMDIGDSFRSRIEERVNELVSKYFGGRFSGHVTVLKDASRYSADCMVNLDSGMALQAAGEAHEPTIAFELAADSLETRLRRYKRRLKAHPAGVGGESIDISYRVMAPVADEEEEVADDYSPAIVAELTLALKTMTVASAVVELDTKESPVFVFRNAGNQEINIVYRRPDGNIGWIDPSSAKVARA